MFATDMIPEIETGIFGWMESIQVDDVFNKAWERNPNKYRDTVIILSLWFVPEQMHLEDCLKYPQQNFFTFGFVVLLFYDIKSLS